MLKALLASLAQQMSSLSGHMRMEGHMGRGKGRVSERKWKRDARDSNCLQQHSFAETRSLHDRRLLLALVLLVLLRPCFHALTQERRVHSKGEVRPRHEDGECCWRKCLCPSSLPAFLMQRV